MTIVPKNAATPFAFFVFMTTAMPLAAQTLGPPAVAPGGGDWAISVGVGGAVRPTFEGSDRYRVSPLPFASVVWKDTVSLDVSGLNVYWRSEGLQVGAGVTYNLGRSTEDKFFGQGDARLAGLGDVPATVGVRGFANYRLGPVLLGASITKYFVEGNNGLLADASIGVPYRINDRFAVTARIATTWADRNYMQNFFGISPQQSANSGYAAYDAGSGFKDVSLSLGAQYKLTENWSLSGGVRLTQLLGAAKNSPISFADRSVTGTMLVGYRF
jgi:MipA family protein